MFDWSKEGDDEAVVEPAKVYLASGPVRHIFEFADLLSEKLFALDGRSFAENIGEDSWSPQQFFSVDNFLMPPIDLHPLSPALDRIKLGVIPSKP